MSGTRSMDNVSFFLGLDWWIIVMDLQFHIVPPGTCRSLIFPGRLGIKLLLGLLFLC